jgi:hypothetical protein
MRVPTKFVLPLATLLLGLQFVPVTALAGNANRPGEPKSDVSPGESSSLVLVNGTINGKNVSPSNRTVVVAPGAAITGSFTVTINSSWPSTDVMAMGVTPNWGTPSTSYIDLGGFSTPVTGLQSTIDLNLTAPSTPGTYYIIAAFEAEYTAGEVMSCTNWQVGYLDWSTGYAVADWATSTIKTADKKGTVLVNYLWGPPPGSNVPQYVQATAIEIVVPGTPTCTLKDTLTYNATSSTLTMNFIVANKAAATWNAWLTSQNNMTSLFSLSQPITNPPTPITQTYAPLAPGGKAGVLSTLTTPANGVICSSWEEVNTGTP